MHGEEPQFPGDFHICLHGASLNHDFFPHFLRVLDDKDDALQERGKGADDKPAGCFGNDFMQVDVHVTLGVREAGLLYVGGIGDEEQILFLTDSGERLHLVWLGDAILMVNLNVSGHDDISIRGVHDDPHRIGDSVRGLKESKGKMFSYAQGFPASDDLNVELGEVGEFFLPLFNHHRGEECGVDGGVPDFAHYKRDAADVVKVSVGNEHCFDRRRALFKVGGVGDNVINARCLLIRELHTNVHNHNLAAVLNGGHILADLLNPAERDDADVSRFKLGYRHALAFSFAAADILVVVVIVCRMSLGPLPRRPATSPLESSPPRLLRPPPWRCLYIHECSLIVIV